MLDGPLIDPFEKASGDETVLHWACQSKTKKEIFQKLLAINKHGWVIYIYGIYDWGTKTSMYHIISRKSTNGWSTLQACQKGGWVLLQDLLHLPEKEHPCMLTGCHSKQLPWIMDNTFTCRKTGRKTGRSDLCPVTYYVWFYVWFYVWLLT